MYIRNLNEADLESLKKFNTKYFHEYPITDTSLRAYLTQSQYKTYGMFHVKHLTGYVIFLYSGNEADIVYIGTQSSTRRKGVGTRLIQHFIKEYDISQIFLEVAITNLGAIGFYKHLGFKILGKRKQYRNGTDSFLMSLIIT